MKTMTTDEKIVVELTETNCMTRWPCHVCGGCTEKEPVLAEVPSGPYEGLRVCEFCLKAGNIDERLGEYASKLERWAAETRALIGRLVVPSYSEWEARVARWNAAQGGDDSDPFESWDDQSNQARH